MFASNKQFEGNIVTLNMNNALNLPKSWIRCDLHYAYKNRLSWAFFSLQVYAMYMM